MALAYVQNPVAFHGGPSAFVMSEARVGVGDYGPGFYLTSRRDEAEKYAARTFGDGRLYACDVALKKPIYYHQIFMPSDVDPSLGLDPFDPDDLTEWHRLSGVGAKLGDALWEIIYFASKRSGGGGTDAAALSAIRRMQRGGYDGIIVYLREKSAAEGKTFLGVQTGVKSLEVVSDPALADRTYYVVFDPSSLVCTQEVVRMIPNREPDAAGCLIVCPSTCSILLLQRSQGVSHGGTWGIPGGGGETFDKDSAATALRETWEEAQLHPHLLGVVDVQPKKIGQFVTYLAVLPSEQAPTLNWEHTAYSWCPFDPQRGTWRFPGPLHSFRHGESGLAATLADPGVVRAVLSACNRATPNPRPDFISTYYNVTTRQGPLPVIEPERRARPVRQDAIASLYSRFAPSAPEPAALPPAPPPPPRVVEVPRVPEPVVIPEPVVVEATLEPPMPEPAAETVVEPILAAPVAKPKKPRKSRAKQAAAQVELFTEKAKPNRARARRERRVARTHTETYEDYAGRMVSENVTEGAWEYDPAYLTPGHFDEPGVQRASRVAGNVRRGVNVTPLGRGNFGEAFLVDLPEGPAVVKIAAELDIHGRRWDRAHQRQNFMHEAGVANELRDLGVHIVPEVEYVELSDGTPALVREYGEPVNSLAPEEFAEVEQALVALEERGWRVEDQIDLYRRADGSLFVADVGIWHPEAVYEYGKPTFDDTALSGLLQSLAHETMGTPRSIPTLPGMLRDAARLRRVFDDEERDRNGIFVRMAVDHARKAIAARRSVGLPVPQALADALMSVEGNT